MSAQSTNIYAEREAALPPARGFPRLLPDVGVVPVELGDHVARHGPVPYRGAPRLLMEEVRASGLTGRGGAAFPVHRKLTAVADASRAGRSPGAIRRPGASRSPVVVGNGAEGEPASSKDKSLLWLAPHLVLDGLQLAAEAVGARTAYLYLHASPNGRLRDRLRGALADRARAGADRLPVDIAEAPPRFLAGQESALVNRIGGGPAIPGYTPPRVFEHGIGGAPTLVQNVETLAHLALIARHGAAWFRAVGTHDEPGSMLCTVRQTDERTDVVETAIGTPLPVLLGLTDARAVLVGGYHGAWVPAAQAPRLSLSNASLRPYGSFLGAGVLAALPADRCGLAETARVARYLAVESAGQCGPCLNGLPRIATALASLAGLRPHARVLADLERWSSLVVRRGACQHPDGTVRLVRSALDVFRDEIRQHERGRCTGTTTRGFLPGGSGGSSPRASTAPTGAGTASTDEDWS
jgi:NADH:ubiquinone oxidoreductase subunit F (NADH-binding)